MIEQTFAVIKHTRRDTGKQAAENTWLHPGDLLGTIKPDECQNHIRSAGFGSMQSEGARGKLRAVGDSERCYKDMERRSL